MNTNMTGFRCFQNSLSLCALDESSLSIGRVISEFILLKLKKVDY